MGRRPRQKANHAPSIDLIDLQPTEDKTLNTYGIYYLTGTIEHQAMAEIQEDVILKHLNSQWEDDIQLIINSPGGVVPDMWALIDLLKFVRMDTQTLVLGEACSAAAVILAAGTPGKRKISQHSIVMIHEASGWLEGSTSKMISQQKYYIQEKERMAKFWLEHTNLKSKEEVIEKLLDGQDHFFNAEEALQLGIVDIIV